GAHSAIQAALRMILGGLANNAQTPEGAESLNTALEQDNHASVLDNLGGLGGLIFGQPSTPPPPPADAGGILGHIFGNSQGQVAQQVSERSGLSAGQVARILMMLAPIVMGYLGRQKQQQGVGGDGLGGLIGGLLGGQAGGFSTGAAAGGGLLDRDGDGSSVYEIASRACNYLRNRG